MNESHCINELSYNQSEMSKSFPSVSAARLVDLSLIKELLIKKAIR